MKKVSVLGSINVDTTIYVDTFPNEGETITGNQVEIDVGGKGLNQAIAIKKSGIDVSFISAIGKDDNANLILKASREYGLKSYFFRSEHKTGTAYIIVDKSSQNKITVIPGSNNDVVKENIDKKILDESDIIVLQNEIPMILP